MNKIFTVVGARPQFIKAAVLSRLFKESDTFTEYLVHTGQHYDHSMSQVFFDELGLPHPDDNLGIGGGSHGRNTGLMLEKLEECMLREKPDMVLVYGDTDSTLAGALAAAKLHIPLVHVEAGLRSYNRRMPEEINRVLTDHCADLLFTPSSTASNNLRKEGIPEKRIFEVGDVMYDAVKHYSQGNQSLAEEALTEYRLTPQAYILATIHRAENTDSEENLTSILTAFDEVAKETPIVLPLHPRTRKAIESFNLEALLKRVTVIQPVGYLVMLALQQHARVIVTDSGGIQKEAYFSGKPCVTVRNETEWVELVETGWNVLVGADTGRITQAIADARAPEGAAQLYGAGDAGEQVVMRLGG